MKKTGLIALGIMAVLVVVAAAQLRDGSSEGGGVTPGGTPLPRQAATDLTVQLDEREGVPGEVGAADAAGSGAGSFVAEAPYGGGAVVAPPLPALAGRKIVRNAGVSLGVEDVGAAVQQVETIAGSAGGFVSESSVFVESPLEGDTASPRRAQSATVTIRVPTSAYASVMNQLRGVAGEVQSESSTTSDVSEEYADLEARQRNLEATEGRYLELLEKAETIPDILMLQDRINAVRLEIELIQGRINLLNDLTDLATIVVQLQPLSLVAEEPSESGWAQQVWDDAWETSEEALQAMGTAAIVGGVVLAWLAAPALAIAIGWRVFGSRRERRGEAGGTGTSA
jgi:hypothetical protein